MSDQVNVDDLGPPPPQTEEEDAEEEAAQDLDDSLPPPSSDGEDSDEGPPSKEEVKEDNKPRLFRVPITIDKEQVQTMFNPANLCRQMGANGVKSQLVSLDEKEINLLVSENVENCKSIADKIDKVLNKHFASNKKVRVSMYGARSFQISDQLTDRAVQMAQTQLEKFTPKYEVNNQEHQTADVRGIVEAWLHAEVASDGQSVVERLKSNPRAMSCLDNALVGTVNIVLQEAIQVNLATLFRGFVCHNELTAVSQMYGIAHCKEHTQEFLMETSKVIERTWAVVHPTIGLNHYVFDFTLTTTNKLKVFAVHPYQQMTDALLFNWDRDARLLQNGPCQIRLRSKMAKDPYALVPSPWREWICQIRGVRDPLGPPEEAFVFKAFRWVTLGLIVAMTAFSLYMFWTTPPGSNKSRRRRRG